MDWSPVTKVKAVLKYQDQKMIAEEDEVAAEYPLTLFVNHQEFATILCTPSDLEALIIGFLASEGAITAYEDIQQILIDLDQGVAYVDLHHELPFGPAFFSKRRITSCCGKSRPSFYFFNDAKTAKKVTGDIQITVENCLVLMNALQDTSSLHRQTGGVHNAALCTPKQILAQATDIGRHNALDKIFGYCLKEKMDTYDKILAFSGRISSEVLLKAAKIGAGVLLSKSAPTDLALQMADELGITAIGFIRDNKMNIYTHRHRVANVHQS